MYGESTSILSHSALRIDYCLTTPTHRRVDSVHNLVGILQNILKNILKLLFFLTVVFTLDFFFGYHIGGQKKAN